jgi:hypothetical protein
VMGEGRAGEGEEEVVVLRVGVVLGRAWLCLCLGLQLTLILLSHSRGEGILCQSPAAQVFSCSRADLWFLFALEQTLHRSFQVLLASPAHPAPKAGQYLFRAVCAGAALQTRCFGAEGRFLLVDGAAEVEQQAAGEERDDGG